jgi:hypothetical protein
MENSNRLLQYIEDAKTWLNKAEKEFSDSNSVRGELILSLAQAEVKHAWELSRGQCVSSKEKKVPVRKMSLMIPMAAGFSILLIGSGIFFMVKLWQPGPAPEGNSQLAVHSNLPVHQTVPVIRKTVSEPVNLSPTKPSTRISALKPVSKPTVVKNVHDKVPVKESSATEQPVTVKNSPTGLKEDKVIAEAVKPHVEETVHSEPVIQEAAAIQKQPKPALQLPVEDDLTNMATHSLKNGR